MRQSHITFVFWIGFVFIFPAASFSQWDEEPLEEYDVIEQRNIFRPNTDTANTSSQRMSPSDQTRRTVTADFNRSASAISTVDNLRLTGIIKLNGLYKAIIEKTDGGNGFYVKVNDHIGDYTVGQIKRDRVILIKDENEYILKLDLAKKKNKPENKKQAVYVEPAQESPQTNNVNLPPDTNIMRRLRTGVSNDKK